jgi:hypothetical protein
VRCPCGKEMTGLTFPVGKSCLDSCYGLKVGPSCIPFAGSGKS